MADNTEDISPLNWPLKSKTFADLYTCQAHSLERQNWPSFPREDQLLHLFNLNQNYHTTKRHD